MDDSKSRRPLCEKQLSNALPLDDEDEEFEDEEVGLSLEELSQAYLDAVGGAGGETSLHVSIVDAPDSENPPTFREPEEAQAEESDTCPLTPHSILEAILFVGRPDNSPIIAAEIAGLMRGVSESEVDTLVADLNRIYQETGRATRIVSRGLGYQLSVAEDLEVIKNQFYGRIREVRLNQPAIDCLALVSYQPGITREKIDEQRGQSCGSILNQLVRRQLLEVRRETDGKKSRVHYYPTDRLLHLVGLSSLDDLPQTEDFD